jgi:chemotaxis protein CheD
MNDIEEDLSVEWLQVRIGDFQVARSGGLSTTLGSCVGIAILCEELRIGGLAHCLLPEGEPTGKQMPARYVNSGIRNLLRAMEVEGMPRRRLRTYIAGGASMFPHQAIREKYQVGRQNLDVCRRELRKLGLGFEELGTGGSVGRKLKVNFDRQAAWVQLLDGSAGEKRSL